MAHPNYVTEIQIGSNIYDIGMKNAIHYHGPSKVSNFFTDSACSTAATDDNIGDNVLYSKGAALPIITGSSTTTIDPEVGCMILMATTAGSVTAYEYVATSITGTGAEKVTLWSMMGEVTTRTGVITTSVTENTGSVVNGITSGKSGAGTSVTTTTADVIDSVTNNNTDYTVITADPGSVEVLTPSTAEQTVLTGYDSVSVDGIVTAVSHTGGHITPTGGDFLVSITGSTGQVVTDVTGGTTTENTGSIVTAVSGGTFTSASGNVVTDASFVPATFNSGNVITAAPSVVTASGKVVTSVTEGSVTTTTQSVIGANATISAPTGFAAYVSGTTLVINTVTTSVDWNSKDSRTVISSINYTSASGNAGDVVTSVTQDDATSGSVITSVNKSGDISLTRGTVITSASHTDVSTSNGTIVTSINSTAASGVLGTINTSYSSSALEAVTSISYEFPSVSVGKWAASAIITAISSTTLGYLKNDGTSFTAITSVPRAAKSVTTGISTTSATVLNGVTLNTADFLTTVSGETVTVTTSVTQNSGSVVTAAV